MDKDTREIVSVYIGDRSKDSANELWLSLPVQYRESAIAYTDFNATLRVNMCHE